MTISEYMRRGIGMLEARGMYKSDILKHVASSADRNRLERMMEGDIEPTLLNLKRLEEASGLSLDRVDPRIHRGEALAGMLGEAARTRHWSQNTLATVLGISMETTRKVLQTGRLHAFAKAAMAIRVCDLIEGRIQVPTNEEMQEKAREAAREQKKADKTLPPEAGGDPAYLVARRVFWKCVGSNPRNFHLRKGEDDGGSGSLFVADGTEVTYRFRVDEERVRFRAILRKSGMALAERELWM